MPTLKIWYNGVNYIGHADKIENFSRLSDYENIKDDLELNKAWADSVIQSHKSRLSYNAAYQRDLRKIKRLGLNMTVAEWRKANEKLV